MRGPGRSRRIHVQVTVASEDRNRGEEAWVHSTDNLQALLKVKRFANRLPKGRRFRGLDDLNRTVDEIDPTIYGFEEKIGEIETSR